MAVTAKSGHSQHSQRYSTRINHVGALLPDTKLMLAHWDLSATVPANLERMRADNIFAKASRSRIPEMLDIFRERYLTDPEILRMLVTLASSSSSAPSSLLDPILYVLATRTDPLLRDVVLDLLGPMLARGHTLVRPEDVVRWLNEQMAAGKTQRPWSDVTIRRLAVGLLATLRDFGILQGKVAKRLGPIYLAPPAFALLALLLSRDQPSGAKLLHDPSWQLFFLAQPAVELLFFEAHQERLLTYQAAGRVIRVEFPTRSLEEYAHALTQRPL
ncbi:MAG: hypothetical protein OJF49_001792 [Ktedonobacterales bacterium]|jgi:hypothetical protein|nr:MAG: hypothetical protein OJF49_001792 [Ktedonobacterales bacterium]